MTENAKDLLVASIPIVAAALGWIVAERQKRKAALKEKQQIRYDELIISLWGYYENMDKPNAVLNYTVGNRAWLYCPDDIIMHVKDFQESVRDNPTDKKAAKKKLAELILAIRKNHYSKLTCLSANDFISQVKD